MFFIEDAHADLAVGRDDRTLVEKGRDFVGSIDLDYSEYYEFLPSLFIITGVLLLTIVYFYKKYYVKKKAVVKRKPIPKKKLK